MARMWLAMIDTIVVILLFAVSAMVALAGVFVTRRLPPTRRRVIRALIAALSLSPTIISAHDSYLVPAWWIVCRTFRLPPLRDWCVASFLFAMLYVAGYLISTAKNRLNNSVKPSSGRGVF